MKQTFLLLLCLICLGAKADNVTKWLKADGIEAIKPVLAETKNVDNKIFSDTWTLSYNYQDISKFRPAENQHLLELESNPLWTIASVEDNSIVSNAEEGSISYYATYLESDAWFMATLSFTLHSQAEVYVNGVLKNKFYGKPGKPGVPMNIKLDLEHGKHCIVVKTLAKKGKIFSAKLHKHKSFNYANTSFGVSPERGMNIHDILNGVKPGSVSVSANGDYALIGYSKAFESNGKTKRWAEIVRLKDKKIIYTFDGAQVSGFKWLPEGNTLSWTINNPDGATLYTYNADTKQLNNIISGIKRMNNYYWAPDMSYIIYTSGVNYNEKNWTLRKVQGMDDRQSSYRWRSSLYKYDIKTGITSLLNWGNLSFMVQDISSDGKSMIVSTTRKTYEEYPFYKQNVYMFDLENMTLDTLWKDRKNTVQCSFSPDNKKLAIKANASAFGEKGLNIKNGQISNGYDNQLYIYDIASKNVDAITHSFDPNINSFNWHIDGYIYIDAEDKDYVSAFKYNVKKKSWTKLNLPNDYLRGISISSKSNIATYVGCSSNSPYKIYVTNLKNNKTSVLADPESNNYKNINFGEVKDWNFTMDNGTTVVGRYYLPKNFDANKKYPLLVYYYGGTSPVSRYFAGTYPFNVFADNGYVVYVLQPSGATGFGQEFAARHQNNWCKITADEIIHGVKKFSNDHKFINKDKIACMGASYGGFTTQFLQTQTDIFACAISHAGISSISSYWGEGFWGYAYSTQASAHSYPWNRKDIYVDQSPLFNADKIKTPMLLLHGTKDTNVPPGESIQLYTALKILGTDVDLVYIKDADHIVKDYNQRIKWHNTIMSYLNRHLKDQPQWWNYMYPNKNL